MKVDSSADSYIGSVAGGPAKAASPVATAEAAARAAPQPGVTVTLSAQAAARSEAGSEVFNARKVAAMQQAIADGSFKVNPEAIADKLLANAAEMLGASSRG